MSYLLDTNVISELIRLKPNPRVTQWLEAVPSELLYLSVLTLGEIRKGIEMVTLLQRKERLRIWLESELPDWFGGRILVIDQAIVDRWGRLQGEMKRPVPAIDSLLAATALHHDLSIVTRNKKDFNYPSLQVVCPWDE
ncbi:MAG: recombinase [Coxiella sp. RIFCSPHIGHO2_12_FULL_44_14]|nr:MAG: recombinase [Coxiella sp. RIFCSPHIGHO2_12_FULL_44_14]